MPDNDLPRTLNTDASDPSSAIAPESETLGQQSTALDLRGYELLERLGGGGMGDVYRAGDPALERDLAVKVMKADLQGQAAAEQRFLREARVTGSLQHPGIVPIHNLGRLSDGRLHYTMRLVRGRTLADILKEEAGQPERVPALLRIFEKMCQAVAYAHSKRVIHRDLKPANVMVGRFGEVQVMDWGLAKPLGERSGVSTSSVRRTPDADATPLAAERDFATQPLEPSSEDTPSDLTRMGSEMGTPAYMPPEQALGEWDVVDERADVFALGSMLCEILTGQPAYDGGSIEALRKAKRGDLSEARSRLESCSADAVLVSLCRECLASDPADRPRDTGGLAQRVAEYQTEVQARLHRAEVERAEAVVQAREECKRRRRTRVFLVLLVSAAAISTWLAVRSTNAERNARISEGNAIEERNRAVEAEGAAKRSAEESKTVLDFFQDTILSAGRPTGQAGGLSKDVSLRQAVDASEKQIAHTFAEKPLLEASIRDTLGNTYYYLGARARAIEQHKRAMELRTAHLGPDHLDTLSSANNLATVHLAVGQADKALPILRRVLDARRTTLGSDHPDTLVSATNLALAYQHSRRLDLALPLYLEVLDKRQAALGDKHEDSLKSMNNLAFAYGSLGRMKEAVPLYEQVLAQRRIALGDKHPDTLLSLNNLAYAYQFTGRLDNALSLFEEALRKRRVALGDTHPDTIASIINLSAAYHDAGRLDGDEALLRELLALRQKKADTPALVLAATMAFLSENLLQQKKFAQAEPLLRQCLAIREKKQPEAWTTFNTRSALGGALLGQKKYLEAEPMLLHGYEGMNQRQAKIPSAFRKPRLLEALDRLVRLYDATNRENKAADWRKKLQAMKSAG